jgi:hypothetical protein
MMLLPALLVLQAPIQSPRLVESSGVAVSHAHPGILWSHNDSGDGPYLYATDIDGRDLGFLLVPGAEAIDWEDIALGPCPRLTRARNCLYIGDTGDNAEFRPSVTVYAVPEPEPPTGPGDTLRTTAAPVVLRMRYPDGAHDVEAIYVSPRDSALYLVSKARAGSARLYRVAPDQWRAARPVVATAIQTLDVRLVTGGAIRSDGRVVALRNYASVYLFTPIAGGRLVPAREHPCRLAGAEPSGGGEAIDFLGDATFVLTTEATRGRAGRITTVVCGPE